MEKIKTIFERDWEGNKGVVDKHLIPPEVLAECVATEKLDGTNVRLTIRAGTLVRLEKRRNPSKIEKARGIEEPWYVDADEYAPNDKFMWEAARNTVLTGIPDGEYSGEALGPSIQGNPLNLDTHIVVLFSRGEAPVFEGVPTDFTALKDWLPNQKSKFGNDAPIEGVVWHHPDGRMFKIKTKDFK